MSDRYDVVVIGGGTAGTVAAIQAGRAGARTLLVEKSGILGGTMTNGGVDFPGLFHAWGRQVIAGIGWELVSRSVQEAGGSMPDFADYRGPHWKLQVRINPFVFAALCDEAITDAGADIRFHTMLAGLDRRSSSGDWHVTLCGKTGLSEFRAAVVVDCTGDANAVSIAGFAVESGDECQPATLTCHATGYEYDDLDIEALNRAFDDEVRNGRLSYTDASWNTRAPNVAHWLGNRGANASHIHGLNAADSRSKTLVELESRRRLLALFRFLRRQPGLANLKIDRVSPECGVRETVRIVGKNTVSVEDYRSGRVFDDAVCYSFYPIDLHTASGDGLRKEALAEGLVPTVPRGALLPAGSTNLLVAGRCIASDRWANSALRVQATCMATGQAAGAMAALAASRGVDPEALVMDEIRNLLLEHNAVVPH